LHPACLCSCHSLQLLWWQAQQPSVTLLWYLHHPHLCYQLQSLLLSDLLLLFFIYPPPPPSWEYQKLRGSELMGCTFRLVSPNCKQVPLFYVTNSSPERTSCKILSESTVQY
jgi:hypothetical protein